MADNKETSCIYGGKKIAVFFTVGILFILAGCTCYPLIDALIQNKINSKLILTPTSESVKEWKNPSFPIYLQFFFFNVENSYEAENGGIPYVSQKGPYSYREHRLKENITWHDGNSTVAYNERQWYVFDPDTSCQDCNPFKDEIININIVLMTLADAIKTFPDILKWKELMSAIIEVAKDKIFQTRTVHELLWGYEDPILCEYNKLKKEAPLKYFNLPDINPIISLQQNNTYQGVTTVYTGAKDINMIEKWVSWKGMTELGVWNTSYANMLNGTDGTQFAPELSTSSVIYVFVTQLCRSLYLTYDGPRKVKGINTLSFTTPKEVYLNATLNPDNKAFCTKQCYPSGILDVGVCQNTPLSLPIFVSAPHFYLGDKSLLENVHGLSPNKEEHGTVLEIETHLGVSLKSAKRLQINVLMGPVEHIKETENLRNLFLPMMYINETGTISDSLAQKLKDDVISKYTLVHSLELALVVVGSVLILIALILLVLLVYRNRKFKKIKSMLAPTVPTENSPLLVNS